MVEHREILDATYGALAHPTRRVVLELLRNGPGRVTDVASAFDISLAAVSKHVVVLENAGLVSRTVRGRDHILTSDAGPLIPAGDWIDTYRAFWEGRLDALEAHLGGQ